MNTTCNPSEHPFCTGSLCCKRRAWGHKGRYDRSSAGFCRNLWFWCPQKEGMLQFTASLGSCFYAKLSGKKKQLSSLVKMQRWWVLFCEGSEGALRVETFGYIWLLPSQYLVKRCHQIRWQSSQGTQARVFPRHNSFLLPGSIPANPRTRPGSCSSAQGCCWHQEQCQNTAGKHSPHTMRE